jgi:methionine synthase I (cobalamin-dependent)
MAFDTDERGGRTFMQNSATECAERLAREGADVIGANCGTASPAQLAQVIRILRASTTLPLAVQMNAGGAHHQEGSAAAYNMSPSTFADEMRSCNAAGADFLGGCCGTTPEHIEALVQAVRMK